MTSRTRTGGDWSFSLRSNNYHLDASSSDDDDDDKPAQREEARLLGELDLASRTDAASYKPNPWTIAKANAAARAPKPSLPPPEIAGRKYTRGQQTVLDLLRAQPMARSTTQAQQTELTITRCLDQAPTVASRPLNPDRPLDDPHIPSDDTLVDVAPSDSGNFSKLSDTNSTIAPSSCLLSPSLGGVPHKPVIVDRASPSGSDSMDLETHHRHPYPFVQPPSLDDPPCLWNRAAKEDCPPLSDGSSSGRELRCILFNSTQPSGPASNKRSVSRSPQTRRQVATVPPIAAYSHSSGSVPNVAANISAAMLPRSSNFLPGSQPLEPILSPRINSLPHRSPHKSSSESSPVPNGAYSPLTQFESYPASSPGPMDGVHRPSGRQATRLELTLSRFAFQPPRPPSSDAHPEASRRPSPSPSPPRSRPLPGADITHGSRAMRLSAASDRQPTPPKKSRKRDAYAAFSSPDSSWTTVPAAKKRNQKGKQNKCAAATQFKLPLRINLPTSEPRNREDEEFRARAATPRVVMYLPPPPTVHPGEQGDDVMHEIGSLSSNIPGRIISQYDQDPSAPPAFRPRAIRRAAPLASLPSHRVLEPARYTPETLDSKRPSPHLEAPCDPDNSTTLTFNEAGLPERYRLVWRRIAKVHLSFADPRVILILLLGACLCTRTALTSLHVVAQTPVDRGLGYPRTPKLRRRLQRRMEGYAQSRLRVGCGE